MTQNEIREKLIQIKNITGATNQHIADKFNVSRVTISLFIRNKRELALPLENDFNECLEKWLKEISSI